MSTPRPATPDPLPVSIITRLLQASQAVYQLKPWTHLWDMDWIGVRDGHTGALRVLSIFGRKKEVYAVVHYRGDRGIEWFCQARTGEINVLSDAMMESADYLKVEWVPKRELIPWDKQLLQAGGFQTRERGPIWPQFRSWRPGWHPWPISESEAEQMIADLGKAAGMVSFFAAHPQLHDQHTRRELPMSPAVLVPTRLEDVEWIEIAPPPESPQEPVQFSEEEMAMLTGLPHRPDLTFELGMPLMPEIPLLDDETQRPCLGRVGVLVDSRSGYLLETKLALGPAPIRDLAQHLILKGLKSGGLRPGVIRVADPRLSGLLEPSCTALGVKVTRTDDLPVANEVIGEVMTRFAR